MPRKSTSIELVPVKTKYPNRPPECEPESVHFDWIQTTAYILAKRWPIVAESYLYAESLRKIGVDIPSDPDFQLMQNERNQLWLEVVPLCHEAYRWIPQDTLDKLSFSSIETPHDAKEHPEIAVKEWNALALKVRHLFCKVGKNDNESAPQTIKRAQAISLLKKAYTPTGETECTLTETQLANIYAKHTKASNGKSARIRTIRHHGRQQAEAYFGDVMDLVNTVTTEVSRNARLQNSGEDPTPGEISKQATSIRSQR